MIVDPERLNEELISSIAEPGSDLEEVREVLAERFLQSLFLFCKAGLSMKDLKPVLHGGCADFMITEGVKRRLLQMARGHLKSSVGNVGKNLFRVYQFLMGKLPEINDFDYYRLIACSTATNAQRFSQFILQYYEQAVLLHWLYPGIVVGPVSSRSTRMFDYVENGKVIRRAVLEFIGVGGKASSRHFRGLTLDDMHASEEADESPPAVDDVVRWYGKTDALLVEPDKDEIDVIGTNCSINPPDVYLCIREKEAEEFDQHILSCYDENGEPVWPERFPKHRLEAIRKKMGDAVFSCNYLNDPIDPSVTEFRSKQLVRYSIAGTQQYPKYILSNGKKYFRQQMFLSTTVDLAGWRGKKGDKNAIIVHGRTADDMNLVLYSWKKRCPPDELLDQILWTYNEFRYGVIGVEEVAYQQCLSYLLEKMIIDKGMALTHRPVRPHGEKTEARVRSMQPLVRSGQIAVAENDTLFLEEFTRFPKGEDHLLACWSYQPQIWQKPFADDMDELNTEMERDYLRAIGQQATA
jgi:predicted phage terminase large subunit-like protein